MPATGHGLADQAPASSCAQSQDARRQRASPRIDLRLRSPRATRPGSSSTNARPAPARPMTDNVWL
jgi:hypothetical protein